MNERNFDIEMICRFCGSSTPEKWFKDVKKYYISMCESCSISTTARKGTKVRYDAAVRDLSGAIYADHHLTRGEVYIVAKTKPWMHGCYVYLEGFGNNSFDLRIFTPEKYEVLHEKGRAYQKVPKGVSVLHHETRILKGDLLWYSDRQEFAPATEIHIDDTAGNHHLVIRADK